MCLYYSDRHRNTNDSTLSLYIPFYRADKTCPPLEGRVPEGAGDVDKVSEVYTGAKDYCEQRFTSSGAGAPPSPQGEGKVPSAR